MEAVCLVILGNGETGNGCRMMWFRRGLLQRRIPQRPCCVKARAHGTVALGLFFWGASAADHTACKDVSTPGLGLPHRFCMVLVLDVPSCKGSRVSRVVYINHRALHSPYSKPLLMLCGFCGVRHVTENNLFPQR